MPQAGRLFCCAVCFGLGGDFGALSGRGASAAGVWPQNEAVFGGFGIFSCCLAACYRAFSGV
jgi:hypothetical protein